ncbi:MAG: sensor histidine kinase [Verrucomicrobiota bacterium]|nr:sensor histidine kinase [Verrucomicrobiota bacterium]
MTYKKYLAVLGVISSIFLCLGPLWALLLLEYRLDRLIFLLFQPSGTSFFSYDALVWVVWWGFLAVPVGAIVGLPCAVFFIRYFREKKETKQALEYEQKLVESSVREQQRIGQDLHDDLGQHLAGVRFMVKVLMNDLTIKQIPESKDAGSILELLDQALQKTRSLAKGLCPIEVERNGLGAALEELAQQTSERLKVSVIYEEQMDAHAIDKYQGTELYRIAQEALNNAIRHGKANNIIIRLLMEDTQGKLVIENDGAPITDSKLTKGMGIYSMQYRARVLKGTLSIKSESSEKTVVICRFPILAQKIPIDL